MKSLKNYARVRYRHHTVYIKDAISKDDVVLLYDDPLLQVNHINT